MKMINHNSAKFLKAILLGSLLPLGACSNEWDNHYGEAEGSTVNETVLQLIKSNPDLSTFAGMIEAAGLEETLNTTQTYTVWAPSNAALAGVDLSDINEVKRIVNNHVARYNISSSTSSEKGVRMLNGKIGRFEGNTFSGVTLEQSDIRARNGVLHVLAEAIPYRYNIREYIDTHAECSLLADFIARFDEDKFDEENSTALDIDENGNTIYDTVTIPYNPLLESVLYGIGPIEAEDSVFSMLVPDNAAWRAAYEETRGYFKVYNADAKIADSIQDVQTSLALVSDLVFRGELTNPSGRQVTTTGSIIPDVSGMFAGSTAQEASNGMIYLTSALNLDPLHTFNKEIEVEAEDGAYSTTGRNTTVFTRLIDSSNPLYNQISGHSYIAVSGRTASTVPAMNFKLPDVLSGKYDVYAVMVPASVEDATQTKDCTRVKFTLNYINPDNGKAAKTDFAEDDFVTSPTEVTTIKVASGFEFPTSDFTDRLWLNNPLNDINSKTINTSIDVSVNITNSEYTNGVYTRRFWIDRIYLIPVTE
jgi:uncharacterized surface protein with fasciclin (FAS1) repeats